MEESKFRFLGYRISKIECTIQDNFNLKDNVLHHSIEIQNNFNKENEKFVEVVLNI